MRNKNCTYLMGTLPCSVGQNANVMYYGLDCAWGPAKCHRLDHKPHSCVLHPPHCGLPARTANLWRQRRVFFCRCELHPKVASLSILSLIGFGSGAGLNTVCSKENVLRFSFRNTLYPISYHLHLDGQEVLGNIGRETE